MSSSSNFWLCLSLLIPSCHDPRKVSCLSHLVCLAQQGPACRTLLQLESQALVRLPVQVLLALFLLDDFTGFRITNLLELPEPYGIAFTWGAVLPVVFVFVASITNFIFKDNLILRVRGHCSGVFRHKGWGRAPVACHAGLTYAGSAESVHWACGCHGQRPSAWHAAISCSKQFALHACSWLGSCPC